MIRQRDPKKKCICRRCENCHHYRDWDVTNTDGVRSVEKACSIDVLSDTLPKLIGSIDGCQEASNETRNRVLQFGESAIQTLKVISKQIPQLLVRPENVLRVPENKK